MNLSIKHILLPAVGLLIASQSMLAQAMEGESTSQPVGEAQSSAVPEPVAVPAAASDSNESELTKLTVEPEPAPSPVIEETSPSKDALKDTLSVDFPDEDVRNVLRNVADLFELNIIIPDALSGRTSIKLRDVTWRQLYKVVLEPFGYTFVEEGNIIKIVSRDSLQLEPFSTDSIIMVNVPATSVEAVLRPMLSPARAATETEAAKSGGSLVVNSLANEIIITDQPATIRRMVDTAKRLDVEPRQVVIETKFVEMKRIDEQELGVRLAGSPNFGKSGGNTQGFINSIGGSIPALADLTQPTSNIVLNGNDFSAIISALNSLEGTRIVSNPTIVAVNGSKSEITIGRDLQTINVTQQITASGQPGQTTFAAGEKIFEGVKVEITPQITSSKLVALQLKTEKREAEPITVNPGGGASDQTFYDVRKREGSLNMILNDGQTAAIGGLMDKRQVDSSTKVPILGDIPGIGALFRSKGKLVDDTNLIIFITANILEPSKTTYRNLATRNQIRQLNLSERDIEGVNYKPSAEEEALYDALKALRAKNQDAEIQQQMDLILNPPPPKGSKR
jgi:type IV pilus assembly protein PilQ